MKLFRLLFLVLWFFSYPGSAEGADQPPGSKAPVEVTEPVKVGSGIVTADPTTVILGLFFIIALIFVVAWLLRRIGGLSVVGGQAMKVVAALNVGPREKVVLLEIEGQQILLGVAPGSVSHLQSFDKPIIVANNNPSDFSAKIKQFMQPSDSSSVDRK